MHRRRVYLILGVVGVVLAGVLLVVFSREREPEYGGKRLSEWVEEFPSGFSVETQQARQAVRHIGTNALPFLVEWIAYEQPPWKAKLIHAAYGLPLGRRLGWMMRDKKASRAFGATLAFECIGAEAEGAIPTLANMATNSARPVCATRAIHALGFIRSGASNVLRKIDTEALERGTR